VAVAARRLTVISAALTMDLDLQLSY